MKTPRQTSSQILDLIDIYINLKPNTALVLASDETSSIELVYSDRPLTVEDLSITREAVNILLSENYYDSKVLPLGESYIIYNYEVIELSTKTIQKVDEN